MCIEWKWNIIVVSVLNGSARNSIVVCELNGSGYSIVVSVLNGNTRNSIVVCVLNGSGIVLLYLY